MSKQPIKDVKVVNTSNSFDVLSDLNEGVTVNVAPSGNALSSNANIATTIDRRPVESTPCSNIPSSTANNATTVDGNVPIPWLVRHLVVGQVLHIWLHGLMNCKVRCLMWEMMRSH